MARRVSRVSNPGQYGRNGGHKNWGVGKGIILRNTPNLAGVSSGAAGAFVQNLFEGGAGVFTTADTTLVTTQAVAAGNKIIIVHQNDGIPVTSVTGGGLSWSIVQAGNKLFVVCADAPSGLASGTTITFNYGTQVSRVAYRVDEFSGLATGAPSGTKIAYSGIVATATPDSGNTVALSGTKDIVIGAFGYQGSSPKADWTPGAGYTALGGAVAGVSAFQTCWAERRAGTGGAVKANATTSDAPANTEAMAVIFTGSATVPGAVGRRNMWINGGLDG